MFSKKLCPNLPQQKFFMGNLGESLFMDFIRNESSGNFTRKKVC